MRAFVDPYKRAQQLEDENERLQASGWLIESTLSHTGGPRWWQGKQPGTEEHWTTDASQAVRFSRREDAEACRLTLADAHVSKVSEHVWLATAQPEERRCALHGPLASDGKCDVCEARGIWDGCAAQPEEKP